MSEANELPAPSSARRQFVKSGALAAAGLALAGQVRAGAPGTSQTGDGLYAVPLEPNGDYALPPLPYAYDALEPAIDAETMRLHHDIHFDGYKKGLNAALAKLKACRESDDFPEISYWENQLAFNGAGYVLHTVFFQNMAPAGTTTPSAASRKILAGHFGSLDAFKAQFSAAAKKVQGSGWAILGYQPFGQRLVVLQAEKHQNLTQWGVIPVLALDVWEHAYYLKYQNRRGDYVDNWWSVVNWDNVDQRLHGALQTA